MKKVDVIIIGAGAAGLMCAIEAAKRGRQVYVIDHANKVGKKILMSGGGSCNFTNYNIQFASYLSHNPDFCKSALSRYTQWDFIKLVDQYQIPFHEKKHGQLFCTNKSKDIVDMLLAECAKYKVNIILNTAINNIRKEISATGFIVTTQSTTYDCQSLVVATGGLSIPSMGASPLGYKIAEQFGLKVWPTRAGLVPLTLFPQDKEKFSALSGVASEIVVSSLHQQFKENILFTHRGLSGPAILQISSYWHSGEALKINFLPDIKLGEFIQEQRASRPNVLLKNILLNYLPKNLVITLLTEKFDKPLANLSKDEIKYASELLNNYSIKPNGTEGYRTAEVTLGGVDCNELSSKTMQTLKVPGLYFIGEVVDVTGWLGGFNFQWAWSSGWAAGQVV